MSNLSDQAKAAKKQYMQEWKKKNRERVNEYARTWRSKPENKERSKVAQEKYWMKKFNELSETEEVNN